jgi:hypothetical protein
LVIGDDVKRELLPLFQSVHPGAFHRADVNEDILFSIFGLNEAEALFGC